LGLGVEQEDKDQLEADPAAVDGHVLPVDGVQGNRVHEGREEATDLSEDLLQSDTAGSLSEGEQLNQVGYHVLAIEKKFEAIRFLVDLL